MIRKATVELRYSVSCCIVKNPEQPRLLLWRFENSINMSNILVYAMQRGHEPKTWKIAQEEFHWLCNASLNDFKGRAVRQMQHLDRKSQMEIPHEHCDQVFSFAKTICTPQSHIRTVDIPTVLCHRDEANGITTLRRLFHKCGVGHTFLQEVIGPQIFSGHQFIDNVGATQHHHIVYLLWLPEYLDIRLTVTGIRGEWQLLQETPTMVRRCLEGLFRNSYIRHTRGYSVDLGHALGRP